MLLPTLAASATFLASVLVSAAVDEECVCAGRHYSPDLIEKSIDKATEDNFWAGDYPHPHDNEVKMTWDHCTDKSPLWEYPFPSPKTKDEVYLGGPHSRDFIIFNQNRVFCGCVTTDGAPQGVNFTRCDLN